MQQDPAIVPRPGQDTFLTDAGLETWLIFNKSFDLPAFAAFPLLETDDGRAALTEYYGQLLQLAKERQLGFVLDTVTWRANGDWASQLGYDAAALDRVNRGAVEFAQSLKSTFAGQDRAVAINGVIGPRGDGYQADTLMSPEAAERYHAPQIESFSRANADMVTALTLTEANEAIGIARAAEKRGMPAVLSFTVETDGRLPSGDTLRHTIEAVDRATGSSPAYYMINCAHPTHFAGVIDEGTWRDRIGGLRANASTKSHAELDEATELDAGDPAALAAEYQALRSALPKLTVLGGCCGTDYRHVEAIATAWLAP